MKKKMEIYKSCGNVFKDLGLPHPEKLLARSKIMHLQDYFLIVQSAICRMLSKIFPITNVLHGAQSRAFVHDFSYGRCAIQFSTAGRCRRMIRYALTLIYLHKHKFLRTIFMRKKVIFLRPIP